MRTSPPKFWQVVALATLLLVATGLHGQNIKASDKKAIVGIMELQEAAWNKGDLTGFMEGYWQSDSLRFIGKSGITYGWQATLSNYQKGYPDKAAMGILKFDILRVESLGKGWAHVTGRWHLQREKDAPEGYFTLLWRKIKGKWVIVADHSS